VPGPTHEAQSETVDKVRLEPNPTYEAQSDTADDVHLEPAPRWGDRPDDGGGAPDDSADGESRGRDDEPR